MESQADVITRDEYLVRQKKLVSAMREHNVDAAIVFGRDERNGNARGRVHYLTGLRSIAGSYAAVIFVGSPAVLYQQAFVGSEWAACHVALDDVRSEPDFVDPLCDLLSEREVRRIALIGHEVGADLKDYQRLMECLADLSVEFWTDILDDFRYHKSAAEVAGAEQTASAVREALTRVLEAARPGMTERELCAVAWRSIVTNGYRSGLVHIGRSGGLAFGRPPVDAVLEPSDFVSLGIEIRGASEYAVEAGVGFSFQAPPVELLDRLKIENEVVNDVLDVMIPGNTTSMMYDAIVSGYTRHGLTPNPRKGAGPMQYACHGIGLDHFEIPSVPGPTMALVENAIIGVHPGAAGGPVLPIGVGAGDTTVVGKTRGRRLVYEEAIWTVI